MIEAKEPVNYDALDALKSVLGLEFADLVRDFRSQAADAMVRLELALARSDRDKIKTTAHTLKGSALSLHCKPMAECCARLERGAHSETIAVLDVMLEELRDTVGETLFAIESWAI